MQKQNETDVPIRSMPSKARRSRPHQGLWSARITGLTIVVVACSLCACAEISADDVALLSDIRKAWQVRHDHVRTLSATWTRSKQTSLRQGVPPDPKGNEPRIETLLVSDRSVRYESDSRRWDIDGGPRGSMSWQTSIYVESFNPKDGWRNLLDSDLEVVKPSATVNRPNITFDGMKSKYVFLLWYRGVDPNLSLFQSAAWKVCHDSRFAHPDSQYVTLMPAEPGQRLTLLFLDSSLGYLPVGSRCGKWPAENAPFLNYEECIVTVDEGATALDCRPKSWISQFKTATGQLMGIEMCKIQDIRIGEALAKELFKVEFPDGVSVYDVHAHESPEQDLKQQPSNRRGDAATQKHGWHYSYYLSSLFAVALAAAVYLKMRANKLTV